MDFGRFYFSLNGRVSRLTYWSKFVIPALGLGVLATIFDEFILKDKAIEVHGVELGTAEAVLMLTLFIPSAVVGVKRLHDLNLSGYLMLIDFSALIWFTDFTIMMKKLLSGEMLLAVLGMHIVLIIGLLILQLAKKGTLGANRYGPDPLESR